MKLIYDKDSLDLTHQVTLVQSSIVCQMRALHETFKNAYSNRNNLNIVDSAKHFFDDLSRIKASDYVPTNEDILLCRCPTSGFEQACFEISGHLFDFYHFGGARSERFKWSQHFYAVHSVVYVTDLSCYDQTLRENKHVNAMQESLDLFENIASSRYLRYASLILLLNKSDSFRQKIKC